MSKSITNVRIIVTESFSKYIGNIRNNKSVIHFDFKDPNKPMNIITIDTRKPEFGFRGYLSYSNSTIVRFNIVDISISLHYDSDTENQILHISFNGLTIHGNKDISYVLNDDELTPILHLDERNDTIFITVSNPTDNSHMYLLEPETIELK